MPCYLFYHCSMTYPNQQVAVRYQAGHGRTIQKIKVVSHSTRPYPVEGEGGNTKRNTTSDGSPLRIRKRGGANTKEPHSFAAVFVSTRKGGDRRHKIENQTKNCLNINELQHQQTKAHLC